MTISDAPEVAVFTPLSIGPASPSSNLGPRQLILSTDVFNGLNCIVTVINKLGVRFQARPSPGVKSNELVLRANYEYGSLVAPDTRQLYNDAGGRTMPETEIHANVLSSTTNGVYSPMMAVHSVEYRIKLEDFQQNGGVLYVPAFDLTLSIHAPDVPIYHPFSVQGSRSQLEKTTFGSKRSRGASYQIRIIDNQERYGDRFVNLNGEVFKIRAEKASDLVDGVYLMGSSPAVGNVAGKKARTVYFSFLEAGEKLRLYTTYADAVTLGSPELLLKTKEEERKQKLKDIEFERDVQRREAEVEMVRLKGEVARYDEVTKRQERVIAALQHEYAVKELLHKRENMLLKEKFDASSTQRKESLEIVKFIPAVIAGAAAVYLAINKTGGKK